MKQNKDQTQVLIWAMLAAGFLYLLFRLQLLENIGHSVYIPVVAICCLAVQILNHEQAAVALRKRSPNFTNSFYSENGRMIIGNIMASALVLELNTFNYQQVRLNFALELISLPFVLGIIFLIENSQGGFLSLERIYFPKQWDQHFKNYGTNFLSLLLMIAMWLPVILKVPVSALLWILISVLLLRQSVVYTNKYNHQGWCFFLEGILVLQLLTLGFQESSLLLLILGGAAGLLFLGIYLRRFQCEKGFIGLAGVLFIGGLAVFYHRSGQGRSMVFYIQWEAALMAAAFVLAKMLSLIYRRFILPDNIDKFSYEGVTVDKSWQESEKPEKPEKTERTGKTVIRETREKREKPEKQGITEKTRITEKIEKTEKTVQRGKDTPHQTLLKIKEKPKKGSLRLKAEESKINPQSPKASLEKKSKPQQEQPEKREKQELQQPQQVKQAPKVQQAPKNQQDDLVIAPQTAGQVDLQVQISSQESNRQKQTGSPEKAAQAKKGNQAKKRNWTKKGKKVRKKDSLALSRTAGRALLPESAGLQEQAALQGKTSRINQGKQANIAKQGQQEKQEKQTKKVTPLSILQMAGRKGLEEQGGLSKTGNQLPKGKKEKPEKQAGQIAVLPQAKTNPPQKKLKTSGTAKEKRISYSKSEIHLKQPAPPKAKKPLKIAKTEKVEKPVQQTAAPAAKGELQSSAGRKARYFHKKKVKKPAPPASKK